MDNETDSISADMALLAEEFRACSLTFTAMGDETRQRILIALLQNYGGMRVGELAQCVHLSRPAVSHHLKILKDAGIVTMFKKGTMTFYHPDVDESHWRQIAELMKHIHALIGKILDQRLAGNWCSNANDH